VPELHHLPEAKAQEGEMMPLTATAELLPYRSGTDPVIEHIESIVLAAHVSVDTENGIPINDTIIAELILTTGSERASIIYCFADGPYWFEEVVDYPLAAHVDRDWVPSGVVFHDDRLWWFDLSWGLLSCNANPDETMVLLFHDLPEGRALRASRSDIHHRRCIAASRNKLRYVEIMAQGETAATVSMWRAVPVHDDDGHYNIVWEMAYEMSFEEIWNDFSYMARKMPRRVPVITAVCPTNPDLVFFSLEREQRLFGVNVPQHRVVEFVDEAYDLVMHGRRLCPAATSSHGSCNNSMLTQVHALPEKMIYCSTQIFLLCRSIISTALFLLAIILSRHYKK
jgi:hypothetical protein